MEGSGGASGSKKASGGSGGGVIRINAIQTMTLERSEILVNGTPGERLVEDDLGSGGGAGGSISIITKNLIGDSKIQAKGGEGSAGGGGGGSGGRLSVSFIRGYSAASQPK